MTRAAETDHPILEPIASRWSPYAYAARTVPTEMLRSVFEAARWAASSYNEQPWSYIVAVKDDAANYEKILSCLVEANQVWAVQAPVLALGCAHLKFTRNGQPNGVALHDLGQASAHLALEAAARGLQAHQMAGILPDRARELFQIPEGIQPVTGIAIGYPADPTDGSGRDAAKRSRKPLSDFVYTGRWGVTTSLVR